MATRGGHKSAGRAVPAAGEGDGDRPAPGRLSGDAAPVTEISLRDQHHQLTRELILRSVADRLERAEVSEITVPDVARAAGVSVRTVYRHFATREELIAETAEWISAHLFGGTGMAEVLAELTTDYRERLLAFDEHPNLVRAMATSRAGNAVRSARRARRLETINRALGEVTDKLPAVEQQQAQAVFGYLVNMLAWLTMRDENGMSGEQIAAAMDWALGALIDDLRRRNEAAGAQIGG